MYLVNIYLTILFFCLVVSINQRTARQRFLWLYFSVVLVIESTKIFQWGNFSSVIYTYSSLTYILFFLYYYILLKINKILISVLAIVSIILYFYFVVHCDDDYPIPVGILMSLIYIILSLLWFANQLLHTDAIRIHNKQSFWVSFSLLIWSVFFLFRLIPMYWLNINDTDFLKDINLGYQIITIISYFVFLRGLFCKF